MVRNDRSGQQGRLILTSYGITSKIGRGLIGNELKKENVNLMDKKIFLCHEPYDAWKDAFIEGCLLMGFSQENIVFAGKDWSDECFGDSESVADLKDVLLSFDYIYVTEGNVFEILSILRERGLVEPIRKAVSLGTTYIGASAGAMIAGASIEPGLDFDKNSVGMKDFEGLDLFGEKTVVIPHYTNKELRRYIKNSLGIREKYERIVSVGDDEVLVV